MEIGNIRIYWKHLDRLETKFLDWKHVYEIRNKIKYTQETMNLIWKQNS